MLYFALASRPVKDAIQQAVSDAVPGTIGATAIQWGPLPWHVRLAEARVIGVRGEEIIRVRGVEATIDLGRTFDDLLAFLHDPDANPLRISLARVELLEPSARVEVRADGWVGLEAALAPPTDPDAPPSPPGAAFELVADVVRLLGARGQVDVPGFRVESAPFDTVTNYFMRIDPALGDDSFYMAFDVPRVHLARAELLFTDFSHMPAPLTLPVRDLLVEDFAWRGLGFSWRAAHGALGDDAHAHFRGSGGLDAAPSPATWHGEGTIDFSADAPEPAALTAGFARGPLSLAIAGRGDVEQLSAAWTVTSPELALGPLLTRDLAAAGRFEPRGSPAIPDRHAIYIDSAQARLDQGTATLSALSYDPRDDALDLRDLAMSVAVADVDVPSALATLFGPALPELPPGAWSGTALVRLSPDPASAGETLTIEVDDGRVTWTAPPIPGLAPTWTFAGHATRHAGLSALALPAPDRALGPFDRLDLSGLVVDAGADRARLAGRIDLLGGAIDLEPYARIGDLAPLARALGLGDLAGRVVVKAARARGTLADPRVDGTLNWTAARIGPRELGQVQGAISLAGGVLALRNLVSDSPLADFAVDASLDLFDPGFAPDPHLAFRIETRKLHGLLAAALGPWFGPDARIALDGGDFSGHLLDPLGTLRGHGRILITQANFAGEPGVRLAATLTAHPSPTGQADVFTLDDLAVTFQSGAVWTGRLRLTRPAREPSVLGLEGNLVIADTSLANLRPVALALPDISAILRGHLTIGGTTAHPVLIGTLELEDAVVGQLVLGDALLAVTTRDDVVEVSAFDRDLFGGFSLQRAALTLDGLAPRRFEAAVRATDKRLGDLVPALADSAVGLFGSATAELDLDVPSGLTSFRVRAAPRDLVIDVPDRGVRWTNLSELLLVSDAGRFRMYPLTLAPTGARALDQRAPDAPRLEVCGTIAGERLDLQLAGLLDLAIVPGLSDLFSVSDGKVRIAPDDAAARAIGDDTCLQNTQALLHLGGSLDAPVAVGQLEMQGLTLVPRGSGRELRLRRGAALQLRRGTRPGQQRILLGQNATRFEGDLDDGSFGLSGEVTLQALAPVSLDLRLIGADLYIASAGEFAFTASPDARLLGERLDTPTPTLSVTGDLSLSEGRFSKSFDTLARAVGGALGVKSDAYTTSLLDEAPWLGRARLDVNVVASDFQIQTALPLARTDLPARLDLTLRGTIAEPRLFRRVDLLPGGTLTYLLFERTFTVSQGAVDFDGDPERPLVEVTAQTQITYLQRAQTALQEEDEKEVAVTLRMSGRVPDLKIELSSDDPTLDQADIQSLLITGKPRGDLDRAQESRVVSADLANVINTVLSAPFVRTASVGVDQKGGLEYRVGTCFAPNLCFDTTTVSDDTETTLRAKFSLAIGDDVVCEGTLKRSDTGATTAQETYEARCRYRIPLD